MNCRLLLITALFLFAGVISATANDPTGWKDIVWGSEIEDFEDLDFGEVLEEEDEKTEKFRGEELTLKYEMEEYIVAGIPFVVKFYFDEFGLFSAYTLTYEGQENPTKDAYDEIVRLLEERYKRISSPEGFQYKFGTTLLVISDFEETTDDVWEIKITYLDPNDGEADLL